MAHTGKQYPVHFRRDFNINLQNYVLGYARAYFFFWQGYAGDLGVAVGHQEFRCDAVDETSFNGLKWRSPVYVLDGHQVYTELRTTVADGWDHIQQVAELWDLSHGLLVNTAALQNAEFTHDHVFYSGNSNTAPRNPYIGPIFNQSVATALAVRWARY